MSYVIAAPEALVAAATDLATLGSTIGAATRPLRARQRRC